MPPLPLDYIICALWSSNDGDQPLDANYGPEDLAPATRDQLAELCATFERDNYVLLAEAMEATGKDMRSVWHDLWLTQNGHGAGFWDGGWPGYGDALTAAAKRMGEVDLYAGDDGKLYA